MLAHHNHDAWDPLASPAPAPAPADGATPSVIPSAFPRELPPAARPATVGTRTLKLDRFPAGFFRRHERTESIRRFLAAHFGRVSDIEVQEEGTGLDAKPSVSSFLTLESSIPKPPSPVVSPPRLDEPSLESADALSLFEQTSAPRDVQDEVYFAEDPPAHRRPRRRRRPRPHEPLARVYCRFETQRSFEAAMDALVGGAIMLRGVDVGVDCAYDASGYFTERRVVARRVAAQRRLRRESLDAQRAFDRPRTPPKAVRYPRPPFCTRERGDESKLVDAGLAADAQDDHKRRVGALPSVPMMRDATARRRSHFSSQVAKRHGMALSALRRTLDDTHDQDGDVPSEQRAVRALETAEALCRKARRASRLDDTDRAQLTRATQLSERLVEKVESAKLRTNRLKEKRRLFSKLLDVRTCLDTLPDCSKFAALVREHGPELKGCTVLVPTDAAFLGDKNAFEEACWGVHLIDGPCKAADLANAGRVLGRHIDTRHGVRCRVQPDGRYAVWLDTDPSPPRRAIMSKMNLVCTQGTVLHVVDGILYPDF